MAAPPVVVVANPTAGRGKAGRLIGKVKAGLTGLRIDHRILVPASAAELAPAVRSIVQEGTRIVAVLGGDGTVSQAGEALIGSPASLAVLPAGTGDDLAASLGVGRLDDAVRLLADPRSVNIDAVRVVVEGGEPRTFLNVAGAGFDSEVNETANAMTVNLGSTGTYIAALVKTLSRFAPARYRLTIDGSTEVVDAMLVVVGNGSRFGGGMRVLPDALMNDGLLDICIVEAVSKAAFLRAFPRVYVGSHGSHPKVRLLRASTVSVDANRGLQVYADGERIGPLPASFEIVPGALSAIVGPTARLIA